MRSWPLPMFALVAALHSGSAQALDVEVTGVDVTGPDGRAFAREVEKRLPALRACVFPDRHWEPEGPGQALEPREVTWRFFFSPDGRLEHDNDGELELDGRCLRKVLDSLRKVTPAPAEKLRAKASARVTLKLTATFAELRTLRGALLSELYGLCRSVSARKGAPKERLVSALRAALENRAKAPSPVVGPWLEESLALLEAGSTKDGWQRRSPVAGITRLAERMDRADFCPELTELSARLLLPKSALPEAEILKRLRERGYPKRCRDLSGDLPEGRDDRVLYRLVSDDAGKLHQFAVLGRFVREDCEGDLSIPLPPTRVGVGDATRAAVGTVDGPLDELTLPGVTLVVDRLSLSDAEVKKAKEAWLAGVKRLCGATATGGVLPLAGKLAKDEGQPPEVRELAGFIASESAPPLAAIDAELEVSLRSPLRCRDGVLK